MAITLLSGNFEEDGLDVVSLVFDDGNELLIFPDKTWQLWEGRSCLDENLIEEGDFWPLDEEVPATTT